VEADPIVAIDAERRDAVLGDHFHVTPWDHGRERLPRRLLRREPHSKRGVT
jgi:hypothetical protein